MDSVLREKISQLDLAIIKKKLITNYNWLKSEAEEAEKQYKNFIYICIKYAGEHSFSPSTDVDEFWHQHILDTEKYTKDCTFIAGKYLHHRPSIRGESRSERERLKNQHQKAQQLLIELFQQPMTVIRPRTKFKKWLKYKIFKSLFN